MTVLGLPFSSVLARKSDAHGGLLQGVRKSKNIANVAVLVDKKEEDEADDDSEASDYNAFESEGCSESDEEDDGKRGGKEVEGSVFVSYAKKHYRTETGVEVMHKARRRVMNPGRGCVGKRIYDSVLGQTCHWCRQKTVEDHVQCWKCPIRFCGMCLINRNGEYVQREMQKGAKWVCPKCRGGCGPGCNNCCNCGPCRRDQGMRPTGQIIKVVRAAGFTNAHDYLIHLKTGETHDEIVSRKHGRSWINGGTARTREEESNFRSFSRLSDGSEGSGSDSGDGGAVNMEIDTPSLEDHKVVITREGLKRKGTEWKMDVKRMRRAVKSEPSQPSQRSKASQSMETFPIAHRPKGRPPRLKSPSQEPQQFLCKKPHERTRSNSVDGVKLEGSVKCKVEPQCLEKSTVSNFTSSRVKLEKLEEKVTSIISKGLGASSCSNEYLSGERKISANEHSQSDGLRKVGDGGINCTSLLTVKIERNDGDRKNTANECTQGDGSRKVGHKGTNGTSLLFTVKIGNNAGSPGDTASTGNLCSPCSRSSVDDFQSTALEKLDENEKDVDAQIVEVEEEAYSLSQISSSHNTASPVLYSPSGDVSVLEAVGRPSNKDGRIELQATNTVNEGTIDIQTVDVEEEAYVLSQTGSTDNTASPVLCPSREVSVIAAVGGPSNKDERFELEATNTCNVGTVDGQDVEVEEEAYVLSQTSSSDNTPVLFTPSSDVSVLQAVGGPSNKDERIQLELHYTHNEGTSQNPSDVFDLANANATQTNSLSSRKRQKSDFHLGYKWSIPTDSQGEAYNQKLKAVLAETVEWKQLADMWELATRRKPLLKLRQTRGRTLQVTTKDEGLSYLDHHPDLAARLKASPNPEDHLMLLRGFFFWLQHSCMEGAYKPWAPIAQAKGQGGDCVEIDGPDCEVLAVVLPLDEKKDIGSLVKSSMEPSESVVIDLDDDDDEEEVIEASTESNIGTLGVKPKVNLQEKLPKAATCLVCCQKFGMDKKRQRALFTSCGHIHTCVSCAHTLWNSNKRKCPKCELHQEKKPKSMLDFTTTPWEPDIVIL